ncbi:MAG TPA: transcriptional regulator [Ruminococcaceae bacterium]|nr:transcriptional regulator [Oscillospiraceae bacterium]
MSKESLGRKIANLRKEKGLTQEELAARLDVSAQAVSKWENDISCPDIMLLPKLSSILNTSVDALLGCEAEAEAVQLVPRKERKSIDDLVMRIVVDSSNGDKVRVNLPLAVLKMGVGEGMNMNIDGSDFLKGIDFARLIDMAERGVLGKLVEVESANGDNVEIFVEEI